jgi:hypothetical protein
MSRQTFYAFFLPESILDRRAAIRAVVAGAVAGGLISAAIGVAAVTRLIAYGIEPRSAVLIGLTLIFVAVTIGTWNYILSAPLTGLVCGLGVVWWELSHGQTVTAIILFVPIVGGFLTAARGILALARLRRQGGQDA